MLVKNLSLHSLFSEDTPRRPFILKVKINIKTLRNAILFNNSKLFKMQEKHIIQRNR